jgi:hypothetical protein
VRVCVCVCVQQVKLENKHVIREDQLLAAVVRKGPSGVALNSSYKNRENVQSVDDLGNLIVNVCRIVPANSGVLVFFPSYAALTAGTERWKQGSVWDRISKLKQIFLEPRESGSFKMTVNAYTDEVMCVCVCVCLLCYDLVRMYGRSPALARARALRKLSLCVYVCVCVCVNN